MPIRSRDRQGAVALVAASLALLSVAAVWFFFSHGWLQWYGDAEAHLNTARRIVESRKPGYDQIGTPWLPLPHVLMLPFVRVDAWWKSGIAAAFPSAVCFVIGGSFLFAAVRRIFESTPVAAAAAALAALNPNLLYLQSTSMTEAIFFAAFMALFYFTVTGSAAGAGIAACAASLTRYEGWFVIPFVSLYFLRRGWRPALLFSILAGAGPLYWLFNNWYLTRDALDFYRGPGSPSAIQRGMPYPGKGNWRLAIEYFGMAVQLCIGPALAAIALAGVIAAAAKRAFWPLFLLLLPGLFYVLNMHSGASPIYVPKFWPYGHYNTRYGLALLPLAAFAGAAIVSLAPARMRAAAAIALVTVATLPWLLHPDPQDWITWAESRRNSEGRRAWTREAAEFLKPRYVPGSGIITSFGDLTGIYRHMGLPLRETFTVCDGIAWEAAIRRPDLFLTEEWAVVARGDEVDRAIQLAARSGVRYSLEKTIIQKDEPVIEIYHRTGGLHGPS